MAGKTDFVFGNYSGERCRDQNTLTRDYIALHGEKPAVNAIMAYEGKTGSAVFDGQCWRELNLNALVQDSFKRR